MDFSFIKQIYLLILSVQCIKSGQIFKSFADLAEEYANTYEYNSKSLVSDSVLLEADDEISVRRNLQRRLLSMFEDFSRVRRITIKRPSSDTESQRQVQTVPSTPRTTDHKVSPHALDSRMAPATDTLQSDQYDIPESSEGHQIPVRESTTRYQYEDLPPLHDQGLQRVSTDNRFKAAEAHKVQETSLFSHDIFSSSSPSPSVSNKIETDEDQTSPVGEFSKKSTRGLTTIEKGKKEVQADFEERFNLILETFHNIGEIMLFEESELVVTDPRQFTQELVKNIMDHEILNNSHPCKPQEVQNILYKGIFNKNSFKGEDANKYWTLLKATGLGVELTPLAMFIPLLIMEQTKEETEKAAVQFRTDLEKSCHRFACRYDVLNIAGNGIDFFHELTKVIIFVLSEKISFA